MVCNELTSILLSLSGSDDDVMCFAKTIEANISLFALGAATYIHKPIQSKQGREGEYERERERILWNETVRGGARMWHRKEIVEASAGNTVSGYTGLSGQFLRKAQGVTSVREPLGCVSACGAQKCGGPRVECEMRARTSI